MSITDLITKRSQSSLMIGAGAVFAGIAAAGLHGNIEYLPATLCMLFTLFMQLAGNYYYQYYDESRNCGRSIDKRINSMGTPVIAPVMLREFSYGMFLVAMMVGFALVAMGGWWVLVVGIVVVVLTWFTCGGTMPLLRTQYGVITTFLLFGPICVITTSLIQSSHEARQMYNWFDLGPAIYMSVVIGFMAINANLLYGYSTYLTDLRNAKVTFVTTYGRKATRVVFFINGLIYTAVSVLMCLNLHLDLCGFDMVPSTLCFIIDLYIWWKMRTTQRYKLVGLINLGTLNVLIMGLLSFIIFEVTGLPDDSKFTFFPI